MPTLQKITPFLWFNGQALAAAQHYVGLFPDSRIVSSEPLDGGPGEGMMMVSFVLAGQEFTALDGGPMYEITPGISFVINCETQEEIDHYWNGLAEGGAEMQCGWLTDRFGITWQVVPVQFGDLMAANPEKVMAAVLEMVKLDLSVLELAARGE